MRAAVFNGPHSVEIAERPDPTIQSPSDAIVRVALGFVCGSDLWYFRGDSPHAHGPIGHEFIGIIEDLGKEVRGLVRGDLVVAPFTYCDGTCPNCLAGVTSQCISGGSFGNHRDRRRGQGEVVRVPLAGGTLVPVPGHGHSEEILRSLTALSDVMCTGHHAAVSGGAKPGAVIAVVGDGAVGLCATIASRRLGAGRIIVLSRKQKASGARAGVRSYGHPRGAGRGGGPGGQGDDQGDRRRFVARMCRHRRIPEDRHEHRTSWLRGRGYRCAHRPWRARLYHWKVNPIRGEGYRRMIDLCPV